MQRFLHEFADTAANGDMYIRLYSRMDQVKFVHHFKLIKGCLPQVLLGPFFNTLSHIWIPYPLQKLKSCFSVEMMFVL